MKRKTTKEILAESFRELAEGKSVDKITVQEIVNNCDYSTATFYRHFKDKYDLIAWDYARKTAAIMGKINGKDYVYDPDEHDGVAFEDLARGLALPALQTAQGEIQPGLIDTIRTDQRGSL